MSDPRQREMQEDDIQDAREWASQQKSRGRGSLNFPEDAKLFKVEKAGVYRLDFLPYLVGKGNPDCQEGRYHWQRRYEVHRVGPRGRPLCCPYGCAGLPCFVCEHVNRQLRQKGLTKEQVRTIREDAAKERQLFNVIDVDHRENGIQIFDHSSFLFGNVLQAKLRNLDPDSPYGMFASHRRGYTLRLSFEPSQFSDKALLCVDIEFKPRAEQYSDDVRTLTYCLDDMIKIPSYDEMRNEFLMGEEEPVGEGDEVETPPAAPPARAGARLPSTVPSQAQGSPAAPPSRSASPARTPAPAAAPAPAPARAPAPPPRPAAAPAPAPANGRDDPYAADRFVFYAPEEGGPEYEYEILQNRRGILRLEHEDGGDPFEVAASLCRPAPRPGDQRVAAPQPPAPEPQDEGEEPSEEAPPPPPRRPGRRG